MQGKLERGVPAALPTHTDRRCLCLTAADHFHSLHSHVAYPSTESATGSRAQQCETARILMLFLTPI